MRRSMVFVLMIIGFSFLLLNGCQKGQEETNLQVLHVAAPASPITLNPLFARDAGSLEAAALLHPQLLGTNPDTLEVEPRLFASFELQADNLTYLFRLQEGLLWSDGTPLTADDVAFTLLLISHGDYTGWLYPLLRFVDGAEEYRNKRLSPYAQGEISGIRVIDEHTIAIRLKQLHAPFLSYLTFPPLPAHKLQNVKVAEMEGHPSLRNVLVGAGPYLLAAWKPDEYLHVRANPDYHLGKPKIAEIYYRFIPNIEAQVIELLAGKLDLLPTAVKVEDVEMLAADRQISIHKNERLVYDYIAINQKKEGSPLKDKRVRQALAMLLDKDELVTNLLLGNAEVLHGPLLPLHFAFDREFSQEKGSLPAARQLLLQAGHPQFQLKLIFNSGNIIRENVALLFKEQAAQVGIDVQIHALEWEAFLAALTNGDYDLAILGRSADADPDLSFHWHSQGAGNRTGYANEKVDRLLEEGVAVLDKERRSELYRQIQEFIVADAPIIWLYTRQAIHAASADLQGFAAHPESLFYNVHLWSLAGREDGL